MGFVEQDPKGIAKKELHIGFRKTIHQPVRRFQIRHPVQRRDQRATAIRLSSKGISRPVHANTPPYPNPEVHRSLLRVTVGSVVET
jgi:hypothetical protein